MPKLTTIRLDRVHYIPKTLEPGILYVSEEFHAAVHLCACGCGLKVSTPLRPLGWVLEDNRGGPSLRPSIGNWQFPCQSHYWIRSGDIVWAERWTDERIAMGQRAERMQREAYYAARGRDGKWIRLIRWVKQIFQ